MYSPGFVLWNKLYLHLKNIYFYFFQTHWEFFEKFWEFSRKNEKKINCDPNTIYIAYSIEQNQENNYTHVV